MRASLREQYPIYIGGEILQSYDFGLLKASQFIIITDKTVDHLYGPVLESNPKLPKQQTAKIILDEGETSKYMTVAEKVLRKLAKASVDKDAVLIGFGGGVIGDLTGFVASIYKRGIRYVHVPTTLLAQVDSSIGGKTAVNVPEGKNLIGSIYNPVAVVTDMAVLDKLPMDQMQNGLCEVIKYAMVADRRLFFYLEKHIKELTPKVIKHIVKKSIKTKLAIARKDPREHEYRKILNYGHTVGHALESSSKHELNHGEAVAWGMLAEGYIAYKKKVLSKQSWERQTRLIQQLVLTHPGKLDADELVQFMYRDKKSKRGKMYFVLPKRIGGVKESRRKVAFPVEEPLVREALNYLERNFSSSSVV